jgi:hypothetical protein
MPRNSKAMINTIHMNVSAPFLIFLVRTYTAKVKNLILIWMKKKVKRKKLLRKRLGIVMFSGMNQLLRIYSMVNSNQLSAV